MVAPLLRLRHSAPNRGRILLLMIASGSAGRFVLELGSRASSSFGMTVHFRDDDVVDHLGRAFLDRTLPCEAWTHAAHFAAALWLLRTRPQLDLEAEMPALIGGYNEACGRANTKTAGYHHTITLASIRAARCVLAEHPSDHPLHAVLDALMASELGRSDWLLAYWSRERLFSPEARRAWVEPDLGPLTPPAVCPRAR